MAPRRGHWCPRPRTLLTGRRPLPCRRPFVARGIPAAPHPTIQSVTTAPEGLACFEPEEDVASLTSSLPPLTVLTGGSLVITL